MSADTIKTAAELQPITLVESRRLIELERIIEQGKLTFIEVGNALAEIKESRLYRCDYSTFEDYCKSRWNFTRQHAYRLIECAPIAECNPQVTSINQARALALVPKERRAEVITKATATGQPLTARTITEAAQPALDDDPPRKSFFDLSPESRADLCTRWWDLLAPRVLMLHAANKTTQEIAEAVCMPLDDVTAIITPDSFVPKDYLLPKLLTPHGQDHYLLIFRETLLDFKSRQLQRAVAFCEDDGFGWLAPVLKSLHQQSLAELRIVKDMLAEMDVGDRKFMIAAGLAALCAARAALRISTTEPYPSAAFIDGYKAVKAEEAA